MSRCMYPLHECLGELYAVRFDCLRTEIVVDCGDSDKRLLYRSAHNGSLIMTTESQSDVPPTVLSTLQATAIPDDIAPSSLHPFSSSSEQTVAFLHTLLDTTERVAHSVTLHSATVLNDSKTVSLLRQQSAGQHTLHLVNDIHFSRLSPACSSSLSPGLFPSLARRWHAP